MDIRSLLSSLITFRKEHGWEFHLESERSASEDYRAYVEQEAVKQGMILLKKAKSLQKQIAALQHELEQVKFSLRAIPDAAKKTVPVATGENVVIDASSGKLFQSFLKEAKDLERGFYDPSFINQESDELLRFL